MKKLIPFIVIFALFSCRSVPSKSSNMMNLKNLHTEKKAVQTKVLFEPKEKVISLQIAKDEQLSEHVTNVPALLVCVSGNGMYGDENGQKITLQSGDYVKIEPNVKHWVDAYVDSNFLLIK